MSSQVWVFIFGGCANVCGQAMKLQLFSPAKINVFLSVLGSREDGFHNLLSATCPLDFGDRLELELLEEKGQDELACEQDNVPTDHTNLCLRAVQLFREAFPFAQRVRVRLCKGIPMGGGMGGGSGNGAAVLWGLDKLLGNPLGKGRLMDLAAALGSDCPLFLEGGATVIRGRGEIVCPLPEKACSKLAGREVFLLLPGIPVPTAWAYGRFRKIGKEAYDNQVAMESRLEEFTAGDGQLEGILYNNFEPVVFGKYIALRVFKEKVAGMCRGATLLSGSGSTLFVMSPDQGFDECTEAVLTKAGRDAFGKDFGLVKAKAAPFKAAELFSPAQALDLGT